MNIFNKKILQAKQDVEMIITSTDSLDTHDIIKYIGLVTGETIIGANFVKDYLANITDVVGGRSGAYEKVLRQAKTIALQEMEERAAELGANAIVGVNLDYETLGEKSGMLMVTVSGTAVLVVDYK